MARKTTAASSSYAGTGGEIAVRIGDIFRANSPRGERRIQVEAVHHAADETPNVSARELVLARACTHLLASLAPGGCVLCPKAPAAAPSKLFTVVLTCKAKTWHMPSGYTRVAE